MKAKPSVLILAGGLGTRLRAAYAEGPKVLAPINGKPFLFYILNELKKQGFHHVILSLGYKSECVISFLEKFNSDGMEISYYVEEQPLGTLGAISFAANQAKKSELIVLNGDTWLDVNYTDFLQTVDKTKDEIGMVLVHVEDSTRYGNVTIDTNNYVTNFYEKSLTGSSGLINGGSYYIKGKVLERLKQYQQGSFETDYLQIYKKNRIKTYITDGNFIDIGTPTSFSQVQKLFQEWFI
ncbi:hypothetical protein A9Q74_14035 [Colwellia sp. 39_35_sub15_T18]|nr:hypothetical protein A9Q74_14035 [Colwellia sp. 39_35_sub15_T18]